MLDDLRALRVALVHDYLLQDGGGERVLMTLQRMFPRAPIFTLFYDPLRANPAFANSDIRSSRLERWPFTRNREQWTLPFMPMAIERIDLSAFDIVISSSSSFAKGVIVPAGTTHICYLHTPTRFLWEDRFEYVNTLPHPRIIKSALHPVLHRLRLWDRIAAERPDAIITNSVTSRTRIKRYYNRDARVIFPPVEIDTFTVGTNPGQYWLAGGRLVPYKRFDLIVRAFAKLNIPLIVFGTGPEEQNLRKIAGRKTTFLGRIDDGQRSELYKNAIGFICPQEEDFGITIIEAMASGRPVLTYNRGGGSETVIHGKTGLHLSAQTWEDIGDAVIRFDPKQFDPLVIRAHAEQFRPERFIEHMTNAIHYERHR